MAQLNYMENVGCAQEDREQMHRSIVSLAQSLQNCMIGSILDSWLCFLLFYIGSSLNGIREKRGSSALFQHITALFECSMAAIVTLLVSDPVGVLYIRSCRVLMLSDWYTMLYNPSPDYVTTVHCTHEAVYPLYTIVFIYYAFCLVLMMLLRPLLVKKIACGLGKSDRFKSIYAALYFFPILTVLQAVGGGLLYYAFPYIILVLSLVTLAVYMSASEIENCYDLLVRKKRLIVLFSHWLLHAYGIISISRVDKLEQDLPLLALVPTPALFYLFTAKFTEPSRILSEGANGH
uniref:JNK1/MAPK8 associated membrane protein n=1 Tax=Molossus molossus TaxID=27622 RepID=A0A7J8JUG8_MOLMO|nr:JNK1/MAPK8 associated membrane protein [Molossus molossus]